jgi:hypothetical protein
MKKISRDASWGIARAAALAPQSLAIGFAAWICFFAISGCAAPGEPIERRPPVPTPISDLTALQQGSDVLLTFTLPKETVQRLPLKSPPSVEIYREFSTAEADRKKLSLVTTIPATMLSQYTAQGQIHCADTLRPEDFAQNPGAEAIYSVHTRASEKKESDDSNLVYVPLVVPPKPIDDAKAQVTHDAILLRWTPPAMTVTGSAANISGFHVYRSELESPPLSASANPPQRNLPLALVGETDPPAAIFADSHFSFGSTYEYLIRSVFRSPTGPLESDDSNLVEVTPRDIFPPATPQGLEVVLLPGEGNSPPSLDLSWAINQETDLAGYNVYRSEQEGARGERINPEPLRTPAFRDMNALPGHRYFYTVTAVDTAGTESSPSASVSGSIPAESH